MVAPAKGEGGTVMDRRGWTSRCHHGSPGGQLAAILHLDRVMPSRLLAAEPGQR
jgi:hypothetical protein